jgi:hypothetical protein
MDRELQSGPPRRIRRQISLSFHCKLCDAWTSDQLGYPHEVCGSCHPTYLQRIEAERIAQEIQREIRIQFIRQALSRLIISPLIDLVCDYV